MSSAIVTFPGAAAITPRTSRYEQGDTTYWRRTARDKGVLPIHLCKRCMDTGMVPVLDRDEVEWDVCVDCAHTWPSDDYPTADDAMDVAF